jgi:hypothetical protein
VAATKDDLSGPRQSSIPPSCRYRRSTRRRVAASAALEPNGAATRCSPTERRPTCAALSRADMPDAADAVAAPGDPAAVAARGSVVRSQPAGATGSAGTNGAADLSAALSACSACVATDVAGRGDALDPVRNTGSTCLTGPRAAPAAASARQLAPAPRAAASWLPAMPAVAAPAAAEPAPRPLAGGRHTVGRA